jgi:hypothetical protein
MDMCICGAQIQGFAGYCSQCGRDSNAAMHPEESAISKTEPNNEQKDASFNGVGGWLLLFCIGAAIIVPLTNLVEGIGSTSAATKVICFVLTVIAVGTGVALWTKKPYALTLVPVYLVALFLVGVLAVVGSVISRDVSQSPIGLRTVIYSFIWFLYFRMSRRVKATYGRNL